MNVKVKYKIKASLLFVFFVLGLFVSTARGQEFPALPDKPEAVLTAIHAASASWDWTMTRRGVDAGYSEADPLARPFVHNNYTMVAAESAEIGLTAWVARRARKSHCAVVRKTWWMWQLAPSVAHSFGIASWYGLKRWPARVPPPPPVRVVRF
jgi:hypothetical protein